MAEPVAAVPGWIEVDGALGAGALVGSAVAGLGRPVPARWSLRLYPAAGEAGGCFVSARRSRPVRVAAGMAADPERAAAEAARRARGQLRRYCAANGLNRLGTLTYRGSGCHDPLLLRRHVAGFFRALRAEVGGGRFPYAWVAEWHKTGHGQHVHFAVGRYVGRGLIERSWPHGFVHIKLLGDLPAGSGRREESRQAARYLGKYAGKAFDARRVAGLHRYEVAQGYRPASVPISGISLAEVMVAACDRMGGRPSRSWSSVDEPEWNRPPAVWASWD